MHANNKVHTNNSNITFYGPTFTVAILITLVSCIVQETEQKYLLKLDGLKLKDVEAGFFHKRVTIALFNPDSTSRQ